MQFLEQALGFLAANPGLVDVLTRAYATEWLDDQVHDLITGPVRRLIIRAQRARVILWVPRTLSPLVAWGYS